MPEGRFPSLRATAAEYGGHLSDAGFDRGLEDLLAGLRARVAGSR